MIKYKIRGIGRRPDLQNSIRERLKIRVTETSPREHFNYGVKEFLGGRTRRKQRKRTRRR
jgi:hypothetical protein